MVLDPANGVQITSELGQPPLELLVGEHGPVAALSSLRMADQSSAVLRAGLLGYSVQLLCSAMRGSGKHRCRH